MAAEMGTNHGEKLIVLLIISVFMGLTAYSVMCHLTVIRDLILYCSPHSESLWLRIASVPFRFLPEVLLIITLTLWLLYVVWLENILPALSKQQTELLDISPMQNQTDQRKIIRTVSALLSISLTILTGVNLWNLYKYMLLVTYKFGVIEQDPIIQRIIFSLSSGIEDGITLICLLFWLVYGTKYTVTYFRG